MNQSLATLIRFKLFQGNNNNASNSSTDDPHNTRPNDRKSRRWNKGKRSERQEEIQQEGSEVDENKFSNSDINQREEQGLSAQGNLSAPDLSSLPQDDNNDRISSKYVKSDSLSEQDGEDATPVNSSGNRSQGKLRTLKEKMNIPELRFRTSSGTIRHSRKSLEMSKKSESVPPHLHSKSARVYSMLPASMSPKRSSQEYSYKTLVNPQKQSFEGPSSDMAVMSKTLSNSSASSFSKFSPRKANVISYPSATSSVRFTGSASNNDLDGGPNGFNTKHKNKNNSIFTNKPYHQFRGDTMETKNSSAGTLSIGRRRSRTVDVSDYSRRNTQSPPLISSNNDFISSITTHLKKTRSNSLLAKSPLASPQDRMSYHSSLSVQEKGSITPPQASDNGIAVSSIYSQPGVTGPVPLMSRRSSSIANAFNSFVNLRSSSASSVKGSGSKVVTPKFDLTLDDFPTPPEPETGESCSSYLSTLTPYGKFIAIILCQKNDSFKIECLNYYLSNFFEFKGDPLDLSLRKLLMFLELPLETQQIDRLLTAFSRCYYETQSKTEEFCPWSSENQLYLVAFSLLMLHTDFFNPNNKYKMTKNEFIQLLHEDQISGGCEIPKEILSYYYDNITAKESPKFDFSFYQQLMQSDTACQESSASEPSSVEFYSPIAILKSSSAAVLQDYTPLSFTLTGRTSSNSFSSYFPQIPASTSTNTNFSVQDDIDIYSHILNNSMEGLNMSSQVDQVWNESYLHKTLQTSENKCEKYFTILTEAKGGYLKIAKSHIGKIVPSNFELLNEIDDDYALLKIIQMGEIRELTVNKKFSIVGSVNKILWKKEYAILTSCGLLLFDSSDWINPTLVRDEKTGISNYIISYKVNTSMIAESPLSCSGLLAINKASELTKSNLRQMEISDPDLDDYSTASGSDAKDTGSTDCTLHLYGSHKKFVWKCASKYERDNWIDSINLMAAYEGCHYNFGSLNNGIVSKRKHHIKDRLDRLDKAREEKSKKLLGLQTILPLYSEAVPLSYKTRNDLTFHIKQLAVKMDWLVYEIKRNQLYSEIIEQTSSHPEQSNSNSIDEGKELDDDIDSINESFIFNDKLLRACLTDSSSR